MADYINLSTGVIEIRGKAYEPGAKVSLNADAAKEPTVDWLIRSGFLGKDGAESNTQSPVYLPTFGQPGEVVMTETAVQPNAPEVSPKK